MGTALRIVLWNNFALAIGLAVVAIAIGYSGRWIKFAIRSLLIRFPFFVLILLARVYIDFNGVRRSLSAGKTPDDRLATQTATLIDRYTGWLQRRLTTLESGRPLLARALFDTSDLAADLKRIETVRIAVLDTERSLLEAVGEDESRRERGVLNITANPVRQHLVDADSVRNALLIAMRKGDRSSRRLALYHVDRFVENSEHLSQVRNATESWDETEQGIVADKVRALGAKVRSQEAGA
jgi:hypothetical protein